MYRTPSSRRGNKKKYMKLNLIPILDAIFIFIFFLLSSASFINIFEINSDVPIISSKQPPKPKKKPLALTLKIRTSGITVITGVPGRVYSTIGKTGDGTYDYNSLHNLAIKLKKRYSHENEVIVEPLIDVPYEELVKVIDAVRSLKNTDEAFFIKDKDGMDQRSYYIFEKVIFGNILS